MYKHILDSW